MAARASATSSITGDLASTKSASQLIGRAGREMAAAPVCSVAELTNEVVPLAHALLVLAEHPDQLGPDVGLVEAPLAHLDQPLQVDDVLGAEEEQLEDGD